MNQISIFKMEDIAEWSSLDPVLTISWLVENGKKMVTKAKEQRLVIKCRLATHIRVREQKSEKQVKKGKSVSRPDGISVTYWYFSICNFHDSMENRKNMNI